MTIPAWADSWLNSLGTPPAIDSIPVRMADGSGKWATVVHASGGAAVSTNVPDGYMTIAGENPTAISILAGSVIVTDGYVTISGENPSASAAVNNVSANVPDASETIAGEVPTSSGGSYPEAITDGGFESGNLATYWNPYADSSCITAVDSVEHYAGTYSAKLYSYTDFGDLYSGISQTISTNLDSLVNFSLKVKVIASETTVSQSGGALGSGAFYFQAEAFNGATSLGYQTYVFWGDNVSASTINLRVAAAGNWYSKSIDIKTDLINKGITWGNVTSVKLSLTSHASTDMDPASLGARVDMLTTV